LPGSQSLEKVDSTQLYYKTPQKSCLYSLYLLTLLLFFLKDIIYVNRQYINVI